MNENALQSFWRRRVREPLMQQLTQGVTPQKLALSCALGISLGVFPLLGTTTALCFLAAVALKLNQPAIQTVNYLIYPAQLALLPVFVRMGEHLFHAEPVALSPITIIKEFAAGPSQFLAKYGMSGVHGVTAWTLTAPLAAAVLYFSLTPIFQKMKETLWLQKQ